MIRPGKMIAEVLRSVFKKAATTSYPANKSECGEMPDKFRGKILFHAEKCIGCRLCMRDCPAGAINIKPVQDKKFEAEIDMGKCVYCAQCVDSCVKKALEYTKEYELASLDRGKLVIHFDAKTQNPPEKKA